MVTKPNPRLNLNTYQLALRQALEAPEAHPNAFDLFRAQHARLHASAVMEQSGWSYEDELFTGLSEMQARQVAPGEEHTIAWLVWHMARCEDITLNILVAGSPQVLHDQGWLARLGRPEQDTGNAMEAAQIAVFSAGVDLDALRGYRLVVGKRTRQVVAGLSAQDLRRKMDPARVQQVLAQGAVLPQAMGVLDYWSKRTVAGLLLMPASRHLLTHLNEAWRIKSRLR